MNKKSFTLVEMLVVVGVLIVLAGLMVPAISSAREKGRATECASNLRQLHVAAMAAASSSHRLPFSTSYETYDPEMRVWQQHVGWVSWTNTVYRPADYPRLIDWRGSNGLMCIRNGSLFAFTRSEDIYLCPTVAHRLGLKRGVPPRTQAVPVRSYLMNDQANHFDLGSSQGSSRIALFMDGSTNAADSGATYGFRSANWTDPANASSRKAYRQMDGELTATNPANAERIGPYHNNRGNVVFIDGHVERVAATQTVDVCRGNWGQF